MELGHAGGVIDVWARSVEGLVQSLHVPELLVVLANLEAEVDVRGIPLDGLFLGGKGGLMLAGLIEASAVESVDMAEGFRADAYDPRLVSVRPPDNLLDGRGEVEIDALLVIAVAPCGNHFVKALNEGLDEVEGLLRIAGLQAEDNLLEDRFCSVRMVVDELLKLILLVIRQGIENHPANRAKDLPALRMVSILLRLALEIGDIVARVALESHCDFRHYLVEGEFIHGVAFQACPLISAVGDFCRYGDVVDGTIITDLLDTNYSMPELGFLTCGRRLHGFLLRGSPRQSRANDGRSIL